MHRITGPPSRRAVEKRLWELADRYTPRERTADYNQAIMDLGATVCRRRKPLCIECPLHRLCAARRHGDPEAYPTPAARPHKPVKALTMVMVRSEKGVLLEQRPPTGVWGGLWGFPECALEADVPQTMQERYGLVVETESPWPRLRHTFSHFHLDITPVPAYVRDTLPGVMEKHGLVWYKPQFPDERGLSVPVKHLLQKLR